MKFYKLLLLLPLLLFCCGKEAAVSKICKYETDDPVLQIYNDLLIELVENHFYNLYLGEEKEAIYNEWHKIKDPDSSDLELFKEKFIKLHNKRFGDKAKSRTIYLTSLKDAARRFNELLPDEIRTLPSDSCSIRTFLGESNASVEQAILTLSQSQSIYSAVDFRACTFNIDSLGEAASFHELEKEQKLQAIGQVAFSRIHWTSNGSGILYYEFRCGGKCGKGELVTFEKTNGRWKIIKSKQLWIA